MADTFHTNMPEFQRNSPLSTKTFARSSLGFSVKVFTLYAMLPSMVLDCFMLHWMYP